MQIILNGRPIAADPEGHTTLLDLLRDERRSVLFSSHNSHDVEQLADSITMLHAGAIVATGEARVGKARETVEGRGLFAIPGLWDMHVHFGGGVHGWWWCGGCCGYRSLNGGSGIGGTGNYLKQYAHVAGCWMLGCKVIPLADWSL